MNPLKFAYKTLRALMPKEYWLLVLKFSGFVFRNVPDDEYLKRMYKFRMGRELDLDNPRTFTEKLQWLKLYDRRPEYTLMADKYAVKKLIADKIGSEYVIPLLGVWDKFDDINFDSLPRSFVLKCTHDSGSVIVVPDKTSFNRAHVRRLLTRGLNHDFFRLFREWVYKDIKPRIIAEEYLPDISAEYKFFCFSGEPKIVLVCKGKAHAAGRTNDFYDIGFTHIPLTGSYPNSPEHDSKPSEYDEMLSLARKLSAGIPQVRIDTFLAGGKVYIGEMTFYHEAGLCHFKPEIYDEQFGAFITLPEKRG
ncbi:MAG: hypothetical protein IJS28_01040 [Synergistaceae bacterium]|nr:hypothetical protein [Synergistaceae bacterium]